MELKLFYKTQRELACALNRIVDGYWKNEVSEEALIKMVKELYINNPKKIIKEEGFTTIVCQQCGKRRLEVVKKVLDRVND